MSKILQSMTESFIELGFTEAQASKMAGYRDLQETAELSKENKPASIIEDLRTSFVDLDYSESNAAKMAVYRNEGLVGLYEASSPDGLNIPGKYYLDTTGEFKNQPLTFTDALAVLGIAPKDVAWTLQQRLQDGQGRQSAVDSFYAWFVVAGFLAKSARQAATSICDSVDWTSTGNEAHRLPVRPGIIDLRESGGYIVQGVSYPTVDLAIQAAGLDLNQIKNFAKQAKSNNDEEAGAKVHNLLQGAGFDPDDADRVIMALKKESGPAIALTPEQVIIAEAFRGLGYSDDWAERMAANER